MCVYIYIYIQTCTHTHYFFFFLLILHLFFPDSVPQSKWLFGNRFPDMIYCILVYISLLYLITL